MARQTLTVYFGPKCPEFLKQATLDVLAEPPREREPGEPNPVDYRNDFLAYLDACEAYEARKGGA